MVGLPLPGNVVGRAVGDAGADDRQAERDVDGGQSASAASGRCAPGRDTWRRCRRTRRAAPARTACRSASGPLDVDALARACSTAGRDDGRFLVAEQAAVAGVRVQRRHARRGRRRSSLPSTSCEQVDLLQHRRGREVAKHVAQGHVQGDVDDAETVRHVRSGGAYSIMPNSLDAGALGEDLGVPGIMQARRVQPFLVQRQRDDAVGLARQRQVDGGAEKVVRRPPRRRADLADRHVAKILCRALQARDFRVDGAASSMRLI